jgi:hypothetical protein
MIAHPNPDPTQIPYLDFRSEDESVYAYMYVFTSMYVLYPSSFGISHTFIEDLRLTFSDMLEIVTSYVSTKYRSIVPGTKGSNCRTSWLESRGLRRQSLASKAAIKTALAISVHVLGHAECTKVLYQPT